MSYHRMLDAYLRSLLAEMLQTPEGTLTNSPYEIPLHSDGHSLMRMQISVGGDETPAVRARCAAVQDLPATPELLELLNDVNASHSPPHAVHIDDTVWVQGSRIGDGLDPEELHQLVDDVAAMARHLVRVLPEEFGGQAPTEMPTPSSGGPWRRDVVVEGYL